MKKLMFFALAMFSVVCCIADGVEAGPRKSKKNRGLATGGFLEVETSGKVFAIANDQNVVDESVVKNMAALVKSQFGFCVQLGDCEAYGPIGTNMFARVSLVAKADAPALLCAPEEGWAQVNVAALKKDNPSDETLKSRVAKEMWRGFGYAVGCGNSVAQPCIMSEVADLAALDSLTNVVGPEPNGKIGTTARQRGARIVRYTSYRRACEEGWAPAPTNDVQKAIYEQIKAEHSKEPTKGLKIEFDPKKGK